MEKTRLPNYIPFTTEGCSLARSFLKLHNVKYSNKEDGYTIVLRANQKIASIRKAFTQA